MIEPACALGEHWVSAKSTGVHWASTFGLPDMPRGRSNEMFFAISGEAASPSRNLVSRSGWPPASLFELVVSNSEIDRSSAIAGAARVASMAKIANASSAAAWSAFDLVIAVRPPIPLPVLRPVVLRLHASAVALDLRPLAPRRGRHLAVAGHPGAADLRRARGHGARAVALVGRFARLRARNLEEAAVFA